MSLLAATNELFIKLKASENSKIVVDADEIEFCVFLNEETKVVWSGGTGLTVHHEDGRYEDVFFQFDDHEAFYKKLADDPIQWAERALDLATRLGALQPQFSHNQSLNGLRREIMSSVWQYDDPLALTAPAEDRDLWSFKQMPIIGIIDLREGFVEVSLKDQVTEEQYEARLHGEAVHFRLPDRLDATKLATFIEANLEKISQAVAHLTEDVDINHEVVWRSVDPELTHEDAVSTLERIFHDVPTHDLPGFSYADDYLGDAEVPGLVANMTKTELQALARRIDEEAREEGYILWDDPLETLEERLTQQSS